MQGVGKFALERLADSLAARHGIGVRERQALLALPGSVVRYRAAAEIAHGDGDGRVHLVIEGLLASARQLAGGRRQVAALYIPGDLCGLDQATVPRRRWDVCASCDTLALSLSWSAVLGIAQEYPAIARALWRETAVQAGITAEWLVGLGRRDARSRLAHLLCEMGLRLEAAGLGSRQHFRLDASQALLADVLGLTSVHVSRTLQDLRAEGLAIARGRIIEVPDWPRLARAAEFEPDYLRPGLAAASPPAVMMTVENTGQAIPG